MISTDYIRLMARYTLWQNAGMTEAATTLDEAGRMADRGAFFGSIAGTLNHLLWGDRLWLSRFAGTAAPRTGSIAESTGETPDWDSYRTERTATDALIARWAETLDPAWLDGELSWWSGAAGREVTKPKAALVVHFFNHGTHHRGQVHAMLTAAGARPQDTDIPFMPDDLSL